MFEIGSTVLYGNEGVCTVQDITKKSFGEVTNEYYVLEPVYQKKSTVFVPLTNETLLSKMRRILSAEEIIDVITSMPDEPLLWIEDETERKLTYKEIISRGDCTELMRITKTLQLRQEEQEAKGKKMHASDIRFLKTAEKMVNDEFAIVLDILPEQVPPFIADRLAASRKRGIKSVLSR